MGTIVVVHNGVDAFPCSMPIVMKLNGFGTAFALSSLGACALGGA